VEERMKIPSFQIDRSFLGGGSAVEEGCIRKLSRGLTRGRVILKVTEERMFSGDSETRDLARRMTDCLGRLTASVLERASSAVRDLVLVLFGGDTALSVLNRLEVEAVEIEGEALKGIGIGRINGGRWHGLRLVTKAGSFGEENALERILRTLHPSF